MELTFSQRKGLKPIKSVIQVGSMDDDLRNGLWNGLWNAVTLSYWNLGIGGWSLSHPKNRDIGVLCNLLWNDYFKKPIDTINHAWSETLKGIREYFFSCQWNEAYDFIEFVANNFPDERINNTFVAKCNSILEREVSGYRFIERRIVEITTQEEIAEVEQALKIPISQVSQHLKQALDLFADRKNPDYRNSIKESISAVEAMCRSISDSDTATLNKALEELENKGSIELHPQLKTAFQNLYNYTSDTNGIRHAIKDKPNVYSEDAKFMLVTCSAFINYLIAKASKAGINI